MGQLFMMGFDGPSVSPQIRSLIENYHLGSILLTAKNLKCIYFLFDFFILSFLVLFFFFFSILSQYIF